MQVTRSIVESPNLQAAVEIVRYSDLDEAVKSVALECIRQINEVTSTDGGAPHGMITVIQKKSERELPVMITMMQGKI